MKNWEKNSFKHPVRGLGTSPADKGELLQQHLTYFMYFFIKKCHVSILVKDHVGNGSNKTGNLFS